MTYALLIPAAGKGERFGGGVPKPLIELSGKPLILWALRAFENDERLKQIVIATTTQIEDELSKRLSHHTLFGLINFTAGGETRQDSVGLALDSASDAVDHILVHDAARPLVSNELCQSVLNALEKSVAAVPGLPMTDTVKRVSSDHVVQETLLRDGLFAVQTPQGIRADAFRTAHFLARKHGVQVTDDVALIEHFKLGDVKLVIGDPLNLKITHPHELSRAEALLSK